MINYSISGKYSNVGDTSSPLLYYANVQYSEQMSLADFCKHIADHGSVYTRADIMAVITLMADCLRELILDGKRISLGELGFFSAAIKSKATDNIASFTADNIHWVGIRWTPAFPCVNLRSQATLHQVLTRDQTATLSAQLKEQ